jgi:hypothetical protein
MIKAYLSRWTLEGNEIVNPIHKKADTLQGWKGTVHHFYTDDTDAQGKPTKPWVVSVVDAEDQTPFDRLDGTTVVEAKTERSLNRLNKFLSEAQVRATLDGCSSTLDYLEVLLPLLGQKPGRFRSREDWG